MIFVLAFFVCQLLITYMIKDFIPTGDAFGIILLLTSIIAISFYLYRTLEKQWLLLIFAGFAVRVVVLFIDLYVPALPIFSSGTDTEYFHEISVAISEGIIPLSEGATAYVPFLSALYYLVGDQRPYVQFFNVAFWVFSAVYLLKTLKYLEIDKKLIFMAIGLFTVMPNSIFMSSILLREAIIIFFISISLYHFIKWFAEGGFPDFLLAVAMAIMSMVFHSGMIGFVIAYVLAFVFLSQKKTKKSGQSVLYLLFFGLIFFIIFQNSELFLSKFAGLTEEGVSNFQISGLGESMYLASFNGLTGLAAFLVAPIKMFYFMFSPLPLDWRGMGDAVSFLFDSTIYLVLVGATIYGLVKSDMPIRNKIFIVLFLMVTVVIYSYGTQSAGTAMRHRNKMIPLLLITSTIANSKHLLKLTGKRWRPKEGEKPTW